MSYLPADLTGTYHIELTDTRWEVTYYGTTQEAAEVAARVLGAKRTSTLTGALSGRHGVLAYTATVGADLRSRKGNARNETGIARWYRVARKVEGTVFDGVANPTTGQIIRWYEGRNPYLTREAFEALLSEVTA